MKVQPLEGYPAFKKAWSTAITPFLMVFHIMFQILHSPSSLGTWCFIFWWKLCIGVSLYTALLGW